MSPEETKELERWKRASEENMTEYYALREAGDKLALLDLYQRADAERAWSRISSQIPGGSDSRHNKKRSGVLIAVYGVAAAVLIGVFGVIFNWFSPGEQVVYRTASHERLQILLPDGSEVFLNGNSVLSYKKRGFSRSRRVKLLDGEAYFDIAHKENNEFVVEMGEIIVRDIGTSFNLKMSNENYKVIVNSGIVSMEYKQASKLQKTILRANHQGVFDRRNKAISRTTDIPVNYRAWQDRKIRFVNAPLAGVAEELKLIYGTRIIFQDTTLKTRILNAYFDRRTEEQIMQIIATSLQIKIEKKDSIFVVSQ